MDKKLNFDLPAFAPLGERASEYLELPFARRDAVVPCLTHEGNYIYQGDILLLPPLVQEPSWRNAWNFTVFGHGINNKRTHDYTWSNGLVSYETQDEVAEVAMAAMYYWMQHTPLVFKPVAETQSNDYLSFQFHHSNQSFVGRQGGYQIVNLSVEEAAFGELNVGAAVHEIGHAIGLYHEHTRSDRDQYIEIIWDNVPWLYEEQFHQQGDEGFRIGDYDYDSQMHYPEDAFGIDGAMTLRRLDGKPLAPRTGLTDGDIQACKSLYPDLDWNNF